MKQVVPLSLFIVIAFALGAGWQFLRSAAWARLGDLTVVYPLGSPEDRESVQALQRGERDADDGLGHTGKNGPEPSPGDRLR